MTHSVSGIIFDTAVTIRRTGTEHVVPESDPILLFFEDVVFACRIMYSQKVMRLYRSNRDCRYPKKDTGQNLHSTILAHSTQ